MSRHIDADEALAYFNLMYDEQEGKDDPYNVGVMGAINYIKHRAPSIDIVRCKECKYWEKSQYYQEFMVCTYVKGATFTRQHDDFCSRGEREGE